MASKTSANHSNNRKKKENELKLELNAYVKCQFEGIRVKKQFFKNIFIEPFLLIFFSEEKSTLHTYIYNFI